MPWVRKGRKIYKRVGGRLKLKQKCRSVRNAKIAMGILKSKGSNNW